MATFHAALEIGTSRTVLAIGEADGSGRVKVTCHAEIPSSGIRKSEILDIKQATQSIKSVLNEIDAKQNDLGLSATVGNAYLVVTGQHVRAVPASGMTQISGKINNDALSNVFNHARSMPIAEDRELLDIVEQDYVVDDCAGVINPKGMTGRLLKLNTLQIVADHKHIQNARTAADAANIDIREPLYATTCAAEAVLEDYEKKNGVLLLDLGGGSTGYAAYSDSFLVATGVIGVGGDHVTSDIAHAFQTTNLQAEEIKTSEACALLRSGENASPRIKVPGSSPLLESRTISRRSLDTVVNARLKELFTIIRETLQDQDVLNRLHAGIVITGGGARLRGIEALIEQTFGMSVRIGRPIHVAGLDEEDFPAAYASIAGALLYAHRNDDSRGSIFDGIRRLFK